MKEKNKKKRRYDNIVKTQLASAFALASPACLMHQGRARRLSAAPCGDSREGQELLQRGQGGYGGA